MIDWTKVADCGTVSSAQVQCTVWPSKLLESGVQTQHKSYLNLLCSAVPCELCCTHTHIHTLVFLPENKMDGAAAAAA